MEGIPVKCRTCGVVCLETTDKYDPEAKLLKGAFFRLDKKHKSWGWVKTFTDWDMGAALTCLRCGAPLQTCAVVLAPEPKETLPEPEPQTETAQDAPTPMYVESEVEVVENPVEPPAKKRAGRKKTAARKAAEPAQGRVKRGGRSQKPK